MKKGFFSRVTRVIEQSTVVLEILDARFPEITRNSSVEKRVLNSGKKLVFVLNKSDLVERSVLEKEKKRLQKIAPCVFLSAREKKGVKKLREEVGKASAKKRAVVSLVGYPNTGKSSVINALIGRKVARTGHKPGFTRGEQFLRLSEKIMLIDSPGIIPFEQKNEFELMLVNSKNPEQLHDVEAVGLELVDWLLKKNPYSIKKNFGVKETDAERVLEEIALKKNRLLRGSVPDTHEAAKILVKMWQAGEIRV
ncbi:MAG: 50S ribosome-binding GTPase [Candidatus Diapherotrites archaeon]|nr:50S ribosome-binding GTPase [Candidatus Diapherotrites archaeon]